MLRAVGRYFRAFGYFITGRVDAARRTLSKNPHVIQATFDRVIEEKKRRIQQYKDAVAKMIAQQEKKVSRVKSLTEEVNKLEQLKQGAAVKAKSVVQQLQTQGIGLEDIKQREDYLKCMTAFNDFTATSNEKNKRIGELEEDVRHLDESVKGHKVQLQGLLREIDQIKQEAAETVADMITAREEKEIADMVSGISDDRTSRELEELRDLRDQSKAESRISHELAGTDTKATEQEFLEYARQHVATDEFERLIGLADQVDANTPVDASKENESFGRTGASLPE